MHSSPDQRVTMMDVEDVKPDVVNKRGRLLSERWRTVLIILFMGGVALECANITLTSKCETHTDANNALKSFLSTVSETSTPLSDLSFYIYDRTLPPTNDETDTHTNTASTTPSTTTSTTNATRVARAVNKPLCHPLRTFPLERSNKRVNVCTYQGQVRVDVRQFINDHATRKGIFFSVREFLSLSEIMSQLHTEISHQMEMLSV